MNEKQIEKFVQTLIYHELTIAALYETYASLFPESEVLWRAYAEEERLHAKWLQKLHGYLKEERVSFEQTRLTAESTQASITYIKNQIQKAVNEPPDLHQCLNVALDIEKSLLESAFFRVFKLNVPEAQKLRTQLESATQSHIAGLMDWRERIR
jgi:rubrerythrin